MSESAKQRYSDPVKYSEFCEANRKRWARQGERKKITHGLKKYYEKNPSRKSEISEERKRYFSEHPEKKKTREVVQLSLDGTALRIWNNMTDAAREYGTSSQNISAVCNGRRKSAGGYIWRYSNAIQRI